jgi:hypothetical protein
MRATFASRAMKCAWSLFNARNISHPLIGFAEISLPIALDAFRFLARLSAPPWDDRHPAPWSILPRRGFDFADMGQIGQLAALSRMPF